MPRRPTNRATFGVPQSEALDSACPARLEIRLFGNPELRIDGTPYALATPRKSLHILIYMLLNRHATVSREYLAYLIWPDEQEDAAHTRLRASLHDLLRVLPPAQQPWILSSGDALQWNPAADTWVDCEAFERAASDRAQFEAAAELYRGELVPALYDEWVVAARERFAQRYVRVLESLVADARRRQDYSAALEFGRRLLTIDPWREDVVRRTMSVRYAAGDRAGALTDYRRFVERLRTEMGIEPMPETQALAEAITRETVVLTDDDDEPGAARTVAPVRETHATPFVGRADELARTLELWERATHGFGAMVGIAGEAGIGKSRLAHELVDAIEARGGRVLWGAAASPERFPYEPFVEALRSAAPMVAALALPPRTMALLATLVPELASRVALPPETPADRPNPERERERVLDAFASAFAQLAKTRPLVFVLEDVHWAGEATLEALEFVVRRLRATRTLVVVTFRDDEVARTHPLRRLLRDANDGSGAQLTLGPLETSALAVIAHARLGNDAAQSRFLERSEGNPLFLLQLLDGDGPSNDRIPASISAVIETRIARLAPAATTFAETAAALGERFSADIVREVLGWSERDTHEALGELIDRRFIMECSGRGLFPYAFVHQLVQRVALERTPAQRLPARHRRIARVLEELYADRSSDLVAEIARHYDLGAEPEAAATNYLAAARRATSLGALRDALGFAERGLALTGDTRRRIDLLLAREIVAERIESTADQGRMLDELERLARSTGESDVLCDVLSRRARLTFRGGDAAAMAVALEELTTVATAARATHWIAKAEHLQSLRFELIGESRAAVAIAERSARRYVELHDDAGAVEPFVQIASICSEIGPIDYAQAASREALIRAERSGSYPMIVQSYFAASVVALAADQLEEMQEWGERFLRVATEFEDRRSQSRAHIMIGNAQLSRYRPGDALRSYTLAERIAIELGLHTISSGATQNRGIALAAIGDFAAAKDAFEQSAALYTRANNLRGISLAAADLCMVHTHLGEIDRAVELGHRSVTLVRDTDLVDALANALEYFCEAEWAAGLHATAVAHLDEAIALRLDNMGRRLVGRDRALAATYALELGRPEIARMHMEALALEGDGALAGAVWPERVAWQIARVAASLGDADAASRWLERAHSLCTAERATLEDPDLLAHFDALPWRHEIARVEARTLSNAARIR